MQCDRIFSVVRSQCASVKSLTLSIPSPLGLAQRLAATGRTTAAAECMHTREITCTTARSPSTIHIFTVAFENLHSTADNCSQICDHSPGRSRSMSMTRSKKLQIESILAPRFNFRRTSQPRISLPSFHNHWSSSSPYYPLEAFIASRRYGRLVPKYL